MPFRSQLHFNNKNLSTYFVFLEPQGRLLVFTLGTLNPCWDVIYQRGGFGGESERERERGRVSELCSCLNSIVFL